jgi:hypothetical protein
MPKKGFIPPVCPDVLVDVKEAYSSVYICVCIYMVSQNQLECNYVFIVKTEKQTHLHRSIHLDYRLSVACLTDQ